MLQRNWKRPLPAARSKISGLMLSTSLLACGSPAFAESLQEALISAYTNNPNLEAGRSNLRAVDENVAIANSGYRPVISGNGTLSWEDTKIGGNGGTNVVDSNGNITQGGINRGATYGVTLSQPIFTGFQTTYRVRSAEAGVRSNRELLRGTEGNILLQAVQAYVGVLSAQEGVKAFEDNLGRLNKEVKIANERVKLTELTLTDLSQSELRRNTSIAGLASAKAELKAARAFYANVIGHDPTDLRFPPPSAGLPKSVAEAQAIAANESPLIVASLYSEEAARHNVDQIRGGLLPQASIDASWNDEYNTNGVAFKRDTLIEGRLSVPLYDGGVTHAAVRQAKQIHLGQIQTIAAIRAQVQQGVATAWSQLESARARVELSNSRKKSSEVALKGVRSEEAIGQRSLLDVLNAEQDILDSQVAVILARRDLVVASYELLAQIGRLSAEQINLGTAIYDPTVHYEEVRRQWFGLDITNAEGESQHIVVEDHVPAK